GAGRFVAVGDRGALFSSEDGLTWTNCEFGTSTYLYWVAYGNGTFVASGYDDVGPTKPIVPKLLISADGINWTVRSSDTVISSLAYCGNQFVGWRNGAVMSSPDGIGWTEHPTGYPLMIEAFAYGSNRFVAVGEKGSILSSSDGIVWINNATKTTAWLLDITYGNNQFVAIGQQGPDPSDAAAIVISPDGITWTDHSPPNTSFVSRIVYGNGRFIAVGGPAILSSLDGATWGSSALPGDDQLVDVTWGQHGFIAVGSSNNAGAILYSADGVTWSPQASNVTNGLAAVV